MRGLLNLERLFGWVPARAAGCFQICLAGHLLHYRVKESRLARRDPFSIDVGQEAAFVRDMPLLGILRVAVRCPEFHFSLLAQGFLAGHSFVEGLSKAPHFGFGVAKQTRGLLVLRMHLGFHGCDRLPRGGEGLVERDASLLEGDLALPQFGFLLGESIALKLVLAPGGFGLLDLHLFGLAASDVSRTAAPPCRDRAGKLLWPRHRPGWCRVPSSRLPSVANQRSSMGLTVLGEPLPIFWRTRSIVGRRPSVSSASAASQTCAS